MTEIAAIIAALLFAAVAALQAALALGAPLGGYVLGGRNPGRLPARLRVFSGIAAVILVVAALIVVAQAGVIPSSPVPEELLAPATWVVAGFMVLNTAANLASRNTFERYAFGGATGACAVLSAFVALTGSGPG